jgi:hypothetical protein
MKQYQKPLQKISTALFDYRSMKSKVKRSISDTKSRTRKLDEPEQCPHMMREMSETS